MCVADYLLRIDGEDYIDILREAYHDEEVSTEAFMGLWFYAQWQAAHKATDSDSWAW